MTFAAYATNAVPGLDLCANDPQNPPILVLLSRGFNAGKAQLINTAPQYPLQQPTDIAPPVFAAATAGSPNCQLVGTNQAQGSANQITELSALSNVLQRHNTPQLTSTVL